MEQIKGKDKANNQAKTSTRKVKQIPRKTKKSYNPLECLSSNQINKFQILCTFHNIHQLVSKWDV